MRRAIYELAHGAAFREPRSQPVGTQCIPQVRHEKVRQGSAIHRKSIARFQG